MPELRTEVLTVNMGPQHPSTHGVLRLVLELDGETVSVDFADDWLPAHGHREDREQKKWQQVIPLVERMDYLSSHSNTLGYVLAVEKLLGWRSRSGSRGSACCSPNCSASTAIWCGSGPTSWTSAPSP